jgi:uncharacterized protein YehS (DUF1456 family)
MENNDILRRLRYALNLSNQRVMDMVAMKGHKIDNQTLESYLKKETDSGFALCPDNVLESFLDGLILVKRGQKDGKPQPAKTEIIPFSNTEVLKKIRIALELKEEDMLSIFSLTDFKISKAELSALFRRRGHPNFKACGDQLLRNFLSGLTKKLRD